MARTPAEGTAKGPDSDTGNPVTLTWDSASQVSLPKGVEAGSLDITRDGQDLVLTAPDGQVFIVENYFAGNDAPTIISSTGAQLTPGLVQSFLSAGDDVQIAAREQINDQSPVGEVSDVHGKATVTRTDGSKETITEGTRIYEGDIIETDAKGAVNITFADESTFSVSENARLAIDEFSFNASDQSGSTVLSILRGVFMFTSGLIGRENPDSVQLETPVGSIGIRGTIIGGHITEDGKGSRISVLEGAIVVHNGTGEQILADQYETVGLSGYDQPIMMLGVFTPAQMIQNYGAVRSVAPTLFTSIDDSARDNVQQQSPAQPEPESPAVPESHLNSATNPLNEGPAYQNLNTGSNIQSTIGATPTGTQSQGGVGTGLTTEAPHSPEVAPPAQAPANNTPIHTAPLPAETSPDTRAPSQVAFTNGGHVDEQAASGTIVGHVGMTETLPFSVTYSLVDDAGGVFVINPNTGAISLAQQAGDYDTGARDYDIIVRTTRADGITRTSETPLTITINAVDEAPDFNSGLSSVAVNEGANVTLTLAQIGATDQEGSIGANLRYTVTATSKGIIRLNGVALNNGDSFTAQDVANNLVSYDHDSAEPGGASFSLKISDPANNTSAVKTFLVDISGVNDAPQVMASTGATMDENAAYVLTSSNLSYSDSDNTPAELVYSVTGQTHGNVEKFVLGSWIVTTNFTQEDIDNGHVRFVQNGSENANATFTYTLSDGAASIGTQTITFAVTNVNDAPTGISIGSTASLNERASGPAVVLSSVTVTDAETSFTPYSFTVLNNDTGVADTRFEVFDDSGTLKLRAKAGAVFDHETESTLNLRVELVDGPHAAISTNVITVTINDVAEAPSAVTVGTVTSLNETPNATTLGANIDLATVTVTDEDASNSHTYAVLRFDGTSYVEDTRFGVHDVSGTLKLYAKSGSNFNFENGSTLDLKIKVIDGALETLSEAFNLDLNNVAEVPTSVVISSVATINETLQGTPLSADTDIAVLTITDQDASNSYTYKVLTFDGSSFVEDARFGVRDDAGTLRIYAKSGTDLNFETQNPIRFKVEVTDTAASQSALTSEHTLNLNDLDEQPIAFTLNGGHLVEGAGTGSTTDDVHAYVSGLVPGAYIGTLSHNDPDIGGNYRPNVAAAYMIMSVTDMNGNPIAGLNVSDFAIENINGKPMLRLASGVEKDFSALPKFQLTLALDADGNTGNGYEVQEVLVIQGRNDYADLALLNGKNGVTIENTTRFDARMGLSLAAGDLNGDGDIDLLFGAPFAVNGSSHQNAGGVYSLDTGTLGANNGRIVLNPTVQPNTEATTVNRLLGSSIAIAGNMIGAANSGSEIIIADPVAGVVRVSYNGSTSGISVEIGSGTPIPVPAYDPVKSLNAITVAAIGDINGDGYADLLIGAQYANGQSGSTEGGRASVILGGASIVTNFENGGFTGTSLKGTAAQDHFGGAVSGAGDFDRDGYKDFAVAAANYGADDRGSVQVYFGSHSYNVGNQVLITGAAAGDHFGTKLAQLGDSNGDGFSDLLVTASGADGGQGAVYVLHGGGLSRGSAYDIGNLGSGGLTGTKITWAGSDSNITFGGVSGAAGDFNGDGFADILVSVTRAYTADSTTKYDTTLIVLYGRADMPSDLVLDDTYLQDASRSYKIHLGHDLASKDGFTVTSAGDVNNDGFDDILIGNPGVNHNGTGNAEGSVHLVYGDNYNQATQGVITGANASANDQAFVGNQNGNTVHAGTFSNISFKGGGGDDVMSISDVSGLRRFDGGIGNDTLRLFFSDGESGGGTADTIDLRGIGTRLQSVETLSFANGSLNDTLRLDIHDILSMANDSNTHSLTILSEGASNTASIQIYNGTTLLGQDLDNYGFSQTANVTLGSGGDARDGYVYTQAGTGLQLIIDSRIAGSDQLAIV